MKESLKARLGRLNEKYAYRKLGDNVYSRAPAARPTIVSDQIMALLEVMSDEIDRLEGLIATSVTCGTCGYVRCPRVHSPARSVP